MPFTCSFEAARKRYQNTKLHVNVTAYEAAPNILYRLRAALNLVLSTVAGFARQRVWISIFEICFWMIFVISITGSLFFEVFAGGGIYLLVLKPPSQYKKTMGMSGRKK